MKGEFNFKEIDRLIHSQVRIGIMAALAAENEVNFTFLKKKLGLSDGNLSANTAKLEEAGFIEIRKFFKLKRPVTVYRITKKGTASLQKYLDNLEKIIMVNAVKRK